MKKIIFLCILFLNFHHPASSQKAEMGGVLKLSYFRPFIENDVVAGYYAYYKTDGSNKSGKSNGICVYNDSLRQTHMIELNKPKSYDLISGSWNGEFYCFIFSDMENKYTEFQLIDKEGNCKNAVPISYPKGFESYFPKDLYAAPNRFIHIGIDKLSRSKGVFSNPQKSIEAIDNTGATAWYISPDLGIGECSEAITYLYSDSKLFVVRVYNTPPDRKDFANRKDAILVYKVDNGEEIARIELQDDKERFYTPEGINYKSDGKLEVFGSYLKISSSGQIDGSQPQNYFFHTYDKDGVLKKKKYLEWSPETYSKIPINNAKPLEMDAALIFHKYISTASGSHFVVFEQVRLETTKGMKKEVMLADIVIFEFDTELSLIKIHRFDKGYKLIELGNIIIPGAKGVSIFNFLPIIKPIAQGQLGYRYSTLSKDGTSFDVAVVADTIEKNQAKTVHHRILYSGKAFQHAKYEWPEPVKNKETQRLRAIPGYRGILDYFPKEKKVTLNLEKIAF